VEKAAVLPALAVTLQFAIHLAALKWHLVEVDVDQAVALKSLHLADRVAERDQAVALKSLHLADRAVHHPAALKWLVHQLVHQQAAATFEHQSLMLSKA
jgi:hypothetical protein